MFFSSNAVVGEIKKKTKEKKKKRRKRGKLGDDYHCSRNKVQLAG